MGLFRPFDEEAKPIDHKINMNAAYKAASVYHNGLFSGKQKTGLNNSQVKSMVKDSTNPNNSWSKIQQRAADGRGRINTVTDKKGHTRFVESLLGLTDEEMWELNEGNCNSDTCKCKGGTCPVDVTDGISTSSYAAKKLANAGSNNQTDMNAVVPNAEYSRRNDAFFIGDGDSPETSKTNIPAILAAKTAGGSPHGWTTDNGINGTGSNVFKLKKLKDDDDGPNG